MAVLKLAGRTLIINQLFLFDGDTGRRFGNVALDPVGRLHQTTLGRSMFGLKLIDLLAVCRLFTRDISVCEPGGRHTTEAEAGAGAGGIARLTVRSANTPRSFFNSSLAILRRDCSS